MTWRSSGVVAIIESNRVRTHFLPTLSVGNRIRNDPGAWCTVRPIQLSAHSVPPTCDDLTSTTNGAGCRPSKAFMISGRYGMRSLRQRPGSAADLLVNTRYLADQSAIASG